MADTQQSPASLFDLTTLLFVDEFTLMQVDHLKVFIWLQLCIKWLENATIVLSVSGLNLEWSQLRIFAGFL